jgi:hypothetical protein
MAVGVQGCADRFIEADGLCRPSLDKCPQGTIPRFSEGCAPVGVPNCAKIFIGDDGLCHPSMDKCPAGTFALPQEGCVAIDGPEGCGTGTWGNITDGPNTIWVDPSYTGGAPDGSKEKPRTTIAAAIATVPSGGRIALAAGTYDEPADIQKPLELVGRCPSLVTIRGISQKASAPTVVFIFDTSGVTVRGVRVQGAGIGVAVFNAEATLQRLHVRLTMGGIVAHTSAKATIERSLIESVEKQHTGVKATKGARVRMLESALSNNREFAAYVDGPDTRLELERSLVADGKLDVRAGATTKLTAGALVNNHTVAVQAHGTGTTVDLVESIIADTAPQISDLDLGYGIEVTKGAAVRLASSVLTRNKALAIDVRGMGSRVDAERILIADTQPHAATKDLGVGIAVREGASARLASVAIARVRTAGVTVIDAGSTVTVAESLIQDTAARLSDMRLGRGINVQDGAHASVDNCGLVRNAGPGLFALRGSASAVRIAATKNGTSGIIIGPGAVGAVEHAVIDDTVPYQGDAYGSGFFCDRARSSLRSALVRASRTAGVVLSSCSSEVSDLIVDGVLLGKALAYDNTGKLAETIEGLGDGLVSVRWENAMATRSDVSRTRIYGAQRAAVVFASSAGVLRGVNGSGSRFGLVAQGNTKPDWTEASNSFFGREQSVLTDGNLPVPEPPPLPQD